jgi:homoserine dehydrogenase
MTVEDRAGVLAQTSKVLGDLGISLDSVIQKRTDHSDNSAEVIYTTHRANEAAMQRAMGLIEELNAVLEIANVIRVEEWDA